MAKVTKCSCLLLLITFLSSCLFPEREEPHVAPVFDSADAALKLQGDPVMEPGGAERRLSQGNKDYLEGRVDNAIREYERAVELDPRQVEAWYNLGIAYSMEDMPEKAVNAWEKTLEIDPTYNDARYSLGVAYLEQGDPDKAIYYLKDALTYNPDFLMAYYNLGNAYFAKGMFREAGEAYTKALVINGNFVEARLGLDRSLVGLGRVDEAVEDVKNIVAAYPQLPDVHYTYGLLLEEKGLKEEAQKEFSEASTLSSLMDVYGEEEDWEGWMRP